VCATPTPIGGGAGLGILNASTFANLTRLATLDLTGAGVTGFEAGFFTGMPALVTLLMAGNSRLEVLPPSVFDPLAQLVTVDLSNNALVALPSCLFCKNVLLQSVTFTGRYSIRLNALAALPAQLFPPVGSQLISLILA
jgi:Leucine-rich repeat (LRR) protein